MLAIILLAFMTGCGRGNRQTTDGLITVDVTKSYPKKELILQDFLDVEYIPLETNDDFITMAQILAIGKEIMLFRNMGPDGDILIFDRNGKGLRVINRRGQGPEEFIGLVGLVALDEDGDEMFINDMRGRKIVVYDLFGHFKRSFTFREEGILGYTQIDIFDRDHLLCLDDAISSNSLDDRKQEIFKVVSRQDGGVTNIIQIPFTAKKVSTLYLEGGAMNVRDRKTVPYRDSWLLVEPSSDTIYSYLPDHSMIPFMTRTPSIQSMDPGIFLYPGVLTDRYFFMRTIKIEMFDWNSNPWPGTNLAYDRQEQVIFESVVYNGDFITKRPVSMYNSERETDIYLINSEDIVFAQKLEAFELVEAYKEGKLKGKLQEIAAGLDEEDNAVIMIAKHKF